MATFGGGTTSTGGNPAGGSDQAVTGIQPHGVTSGEGTLAAGVTGVAFTDASRSATFGLNTGAVAGYSDWTKIVTALVVRDTIDNLRHKAVFAQSWNEPLHAQHVAGTNQFVYTGFGDLGPAVELLEGVPPETEKMLFDTFAFGGKQVGKTTAMTDLAEIFSPFDLYSKAAEKLAWNAVEYVEATLATLLASSTILPPATALPAGYAQGVAAAVTRAKRALVPTFNDGSYHVFVSPELASVLMTQTGELGWTDTQKYANPQAIMNGEIGMFRGARFIETTRLTSATEGILFGPGSYVIGDFQSIEAYRVGRGGDHADPLAQRALMGWKGMMGFALTKFDGSPAMGPVGNIAGEKVFKFTLVP